MGAKRSGRCGSFLVGLALLLQVSCGSSASSTRAVPDRRDRAKAAGDRFSADAGRPVLFTDGSSTLAVTTVDSNPTGSKVHNEAALVPAKGATRRLPAIPHPVPLHALTGSPLDGGYLVAGIECPPIDVDKDGNPADGDDTDVCGPASDEVITYLLTAAGEWRAAARAPDDFRYGLVAAGEVDGKATFVGHDRVVAYDPAADAWTSQPGSLGYATFACSGGHTAAFLGVGVPVSQPASTQLGAQSLILWRDGTEAGRVELPDAPSPGNYSYACSLDGTRLVRLDGNGPTLVVHLDDLRVDTLPPAPAMTDDHRFLDVVGVDLEGDTPSLEMSSLGGGMGTSIRTSGANGTTVSTLIEDDDPTFEAHRFELSPDATTWIDGPSGIGPVERPVAAVQTGSGWVVVRTEHGDEGQATRVTGFRVVRT